MSANDSEQPDNKTSRNAAQEESSTDKATDAQSRLYIEDLIKSGKAAVAKDGKLPPGATHEIVGMDASGVPILVRRRFS